MLREVSGVNGVLLSAWREELNKSSWGRDQIEEQDFISEEEESCVLNPPFNTSPWTAARTTTTTRKNRLHRKWLFPPFFPAPILRCSYFSMAWIFLRAVKEKIVRCAVDSCTVCLYYSRLLFSFRLFLVYNEFRTESATGSPGVGTTGSRCSASHRAVTAASVSFTNRRFT